MTPGTTPIPRRCRATRDLGSRSGHDGYTLVEAVVAMVVFSLGILSLAALVPLGGRVIAEAGEQTHASELAASCAERLLTTPYDDSSLAPGSHADAQNPYAGRYYLTWAVEENQPISSCKRITVLVQWPRPNSTTRARLVVVLPRAGS